MQDVFIASEGHQTIYEVSLLLESTLLCLDSEWVAPCRDILHLEWLVTLLGVPACLEGALLFVEP